MTSPGESYDSVEDQCQGRASSAVHLVEGWSVFHFHFLKIFRALSVVHFHFLKISRVFSVVHSHFLKISTLSICRSQDWDERRVPGGDAGVPRWRHCHLADPQNPGELSLFCKTIWNGTINKKDSHTLLAILPTAKSTKIQHENYDEVTSGLMFGLRYQKRVNLVCENQEIKVVSLPRCLTRAPTHWGGRTGTAATRCLYKLGPCWWHHDLTMIMSRWCHDPGWLGPRGFGDWARRRLRAAQGRQPWVPLCPKFQVNLKKNSNQDYKYPRRRLDRGSTTLVVTY